MCRVCQVGSSLHLTRLKLVVVFVVAFSYFFLGFSSRRITSTPRGIHFASLTFSNLHFFLTFFGRVLRRGDLFQQPGVSVCCHLWGQSTHSLSRWYHFLSFIPSDDGSVNPYSAVCVCVCVRPSSQKMFTLFTPLIPGWERGEDHFLLPFPGTHFHLPRRNRVRISHAHRFPGSANFPKRRK